MKIGLITDTHYNFKKANKDFHNYFSKFYKDIFFPTLEKNNIKTVIHLGDAFDNRKGIDYWALEWAKENVYDKFRDLGIKVYSIVGNHDAYYKNTNEINSIDTLLDRYDNIVKISEPTQINVKGMETVFLPWICSENQKKTLELLEKTDAKVVFGHLELGGFTVYPGYVHPSGMDKAIFQKFDRVFSGHYHTRSNDKKIFYLGNPYQMFWSDVNDVRGFHIFDTEDYKLDFYKNSHTMFEKIYYDENNLVDSDDIEIENKMIKVVIKNKKDELKFDKYIDSLIKKNPLDLKVIETVDVYDKDVSCEDIPIEDTMSILDKYVEESQFNLNKNKIKKLLRQVYQEALEIE
jgi:DNA repair exonuclease SbcCD nuclease subunit